MWTHRLGSPREAVVSTRLSTQRMLSFSPMGTRVGLMIRFSSLVPLNFLRVQNFTAPSPNGNPASVTARLECMEIPQRGFLWRQRSLGPCFGLWSSPMFSRAYENVVVSCNIRTVPAEPAKRSRVDRTWPDSMSASLTRSFAKNRYAALAFAQSWHANGILSQLASESWFKTILNRLPNRRSRNWQPNTSSVIHDARPSPSALTSGSCNAFMHRWLAYYVTAKTRSCYISETSIPIANHRCMKALQ